MIIRLQFREYNVRFKLFQWMKILYYESNFKTKSRNKTSITLQNITHLKGHNDQSEHQISLIDNRKARFITPITHIYLSVIEIAAS